MLPWCMARYYVIRALKSSHTEHIAYASTLCVVMHLHKRFDFWRRLKPAQNKYIRMIYMIHETNSRTKGITQTYNTAHFTASLPAE